VDYRRVGRSGLAVSELGLGGNNFGGRLGLKETEAVVNAAIDGGVTFIDTAEQYGATPGASEEVLGKVLKGRRDQIVLGSKFGHFRGQSSLTPATGGRAGRSAIRHAIEGSLRRLGTDHIDLYQYHRFDPATPLEETLDALQDLVQEGKIRYFGHTTFRGWQVADAHYLALARGHVGFVSASYQWNMIERWAETDAVPGAERYGLGVIPYFPLAQGLLTGKFFSGIPEGTRLATTPELVTEDKLAVAARYQKWADEHGISLLEVAFGGLTRHPVVSTVIAGVSNPEQVRSNIRAVSWHPSPEESAELDEINPAPRWIE